METDIVPVINLACSPESLDSSIGFNKLPNFAYKKSCTYHISGFTRIMVDVVIYLLTIFLYILCIINKIGL